MSFFKQFAIFATMFSTLSCGSMPGLDDLAEQPGEIVEDLNNLDFLPSLEEANKSQVRDFTTIAARTSRNAAVRVEVNYGPTKIRGSGTYFKYRDGHIVITAAHLYAFGGAKVMESKANFVSPEQEVVGILVYIDEAADIAIFDVPKIPSREPAIFYPAENFPIGQKTYYSGFPGSNNLLTFSGTIAGKGYKSDLAMHSFAWGGSSGSGVFNMQGRYVGVVVSIMVGRAPNGPQLAGSVVYVAPATLIDQKVLKQNVKLVRKMKNAGF
jgi:S1-C subfamily serine protease